MGSSVSVPLTCRALKCWLEGDTVLKVLLFSKDDYDKIKVATLDLDDYIGMKDGEFDVTGSNFSDSTTNIYLENFILHAAFQWTDSDGNTAVSVGALNLNLFVGVDGDDLKFLRPSTNIGDSATAFVLDGSIYGGLCLGSNGSLLDSSVNLNDKLGNKNGKFVKDEKNYSLTARNVQLDESGLILCAQLQNYDKEWVDATFDLSTIYANIKGELKYESADDALDRDGMVTQFIETVPYVGYLAVAGHLRASNNDHAKRALARTVYSTIVFSAATTGTIVGGPIGLAIGATVGTLLGMAAEGIIRTTVTSEEVKDNLDEISLKRFVKESLINTVSGLAAGTLGKHTSRWVMGSAGKNMTDQVLQRARARLVEEGVTQVSGQVITTSSGAVVSAIQEYVADPDAEV